MRQVPYILIGNGRVATHFCHYFSLSNIPYRQWSRSQSLATLKTLVDQSDTVLLLITDSEIENFIIENAFLQKKRLIHFSGSLYTPLAYGAHPLFPFREKLYDLDVYQKIPFILEHEEYCLKDLLPELANPSYNIPKALKPFYHSLCVLSGNFTVILWQKFFSELEKLNIPKEVAHLYLQQNSENLQQDPNCLTGPLYRRDQKTIAANLDALKEDPFQKIYKAFVETYLGEQS